MHIATKRIPYFSNSCSFSEYVGGFEKIQFNTYIYEKILHDLDNITIYEPADENLVTAFVPSDTTCFTNSPSSIRRTDV